ncbi:metallophosphoesterase [Devosia salina]|uniref:Metallophosphoesterase n=1 Tax=Devosia salina TaxID=2860336 RepID=A0ABX8W9W1_9HYPH|nr:metallophosphoesterase [Devosia salina]QYO75668.1 metallophosphoesterase [Devosia salina]
MSDLHVDAAPYELPPTSAGVDCIVIAGDVADGHDRSSRWLREQAVPRGLPVIYVLGNHDFYGHDIDDDAEELYRDAGVELLHIGRRSIEIAGVRIIGLTLWTDYAIAGDVDAARVWARQNMPDFVNIDIGQRRLSPRHLDHFHKLHRELIEMDLADPFDGSTIVVTHHAPHPKSLRSPMLTADDASYASDLTAIIERYEPAVWIHGHVHSSRNYNVGATRIVCNPRGYAVTSRDGRRFENPGFNPQLVLEI